MSLTERTVASGTQKAAILLSILGEEDAAPVLRNLPHEDIARITAEVTNLSHIPAEITLQVLEEYRGMMTTQEFTAVGGRDRAVRMLSKAFGEAGAQKMLELAGPAKEGDTFKSESLKKTEPEQLARFLANEHSQTKALILGQLEPKQASMVLMQMSPEERADCVKRLATLKQFSPEAVAKASRILGNRFGGNGEPARRSDTGYKSLAEVMNRMEATASRQVLESIESEDPNLAISIRDMMFTFENFLEVPEPDLRELVTSLDKKTLMIALKGASEELRAHIYRTMSSRAVEIMKEDSEMMGPVRSKDVGKAQSEIVAIARKLEAEGKIVLKSDGDDEYVL